MNYHQGGFFLKYFMSRSAASSSKANGVYYNCTTLFTGTFVELIISPVAQLVRALH